MWNVNKLVQGNLIVHTSVEPTQLPAMRNKVMFQPTSELYTSYDI